MKDKVGDRFLSSAGAGGNCARPMRLPDPSPVLDKNRAPMGPETLSSNGAGVWRKAPMAFPDSSSVLDKCQPAIKLCSVIIWAPMVCAEPCVSTVIFEIITFLIQKHFKTVTVTVILGKLIQITFKTVIGNQWK